MGSYKVFNFNDLALFHIVYLCFILDLRRDNNEHNRGFFSLNYNSSFFITYNKETISVLLFLKGYILLVLS